MVRGKEGGEGGRERWKRCNGRERKKWEEEREEEGEWEGVGRRERGEGRE